MSETDHPILVLIGTLVSIPAVLIAMMALDAWVLGRVSLWAGWPLTMQQGVAIAAAVGVLTMRHTDQKAASWQTVLGRLFGLVLGKLILLGCAWVYLVHLNPIT